MPRGPRNAPGGVVYHVCNRGVGRRRIFFKDADYTAFERILVEAKAQVPMRILAYVVMPNHWHMILWPEKDGAISSFLRWATNTHTQRYHAHYHTSGTGHVYQGRFKSFPIQTDLHLLIALRYVERNALRAGLVERAEQWRWSSLWRRESGVGVELLSEWPVERPGDWVTFVNEAQTEGELCALRESVKRGRPFGSEGWQEGTAKALGLEATLRAWGRPKKVLVEEGSEI